MKKVDLLVKGNIIAHILGGGTNTSINIEALGNPGDYDLTNALIIEGNLDIETIKGYGVIVCTGVAASTGKEGDNVSI